MVTLTLINRPARHFLISNMLLLCTACASNGPSEYGVVIGPDRLAKLETSAIKEIHLELPVGDIEIVSSLSDQLILDLKISCDKNNKGCNKLAKSVTLEQRYEGQILFVSPSKKSRFAYRNSQAKYLIEAPHNIPMNIKAGFGALSILGVKSKLNVSMTAGEIHVEIPAVAVRNVWLDANVGDVSLSGPDLSREGKRTLLVGAEVDWRNGEGTHDIQINLGAGDISVRLTD